MHKLIPIVFGCLILVFYQQLANYYRSFGKEKITPVRWKYQELIIIIIGLLWIFVGFANLLK